MSIKKVDLYTDGACRGNPGPGGWGVVMVYQNHEKTLSGSAQQTTNNQMELLAAIKGLAALTQACDVTVTTDSQYLRRGITEWIHNWKKRHWKTTDNKPVKNQAYWQSLESEVARHHQVTWKWVKGHSMHKYNDWADKLATEAIEQ